MNLAGSYAVIRGSEFYLLNASIPPYQPKNLREEYDPNRSRRLLLNREEIGHLTGAIREKQLTLLPLKAYTKNGFVKILLGLGKSRKKSDKRELLKKRSAEREMRNGA